MHVTDFAGVVIPSGVDVISDVIIGIENTLVNLVRNAQYQAHREVLAILEYLGCLPCSEIKPVRKRTFIQEWGPVGNMTANTRHRLTNEQSDDSV